MMMFSVLGYQHGNEDVIAALVSAREHLRPGGLFLFDVLVGSTVIAHGPRTLATVHELDGTQILRFLTGHLDYASHLLIQDFRLWQLRGDRLVAQEQEEHRIRLFFPLELELFLAWCDLECVHTEALAEIGQEPDDTTWNVLKVARPRGNGQPPGG